MYISKVFVTKMDISGAFHVKSDHVLAHVSKLVKNVCYWNAIIHISMACIVLVFLQHEYLLNIKTLVFPSFTPDPRHISMGNLISNDSTQ